MLLLSPRVNGESLLLFIVLDFELSYFFFLYFGGIYKRCAHDI